MNWFNNMKIRTRMLIGFMLVIALTMTLVVIAVTQIRRISERYMVVIRHPLTLDDTLREFESEYRDLRRVVATIATRAGNVHLIPEHRESLFRDARARYDAALGRLQAASGIVEGNPLLTRAEKDARLANNAVLRGLLGRYGDEVMSPVLDSVREENSDSSAPFFEKARSVTASIQAKFDEMILSAAETAASHVSDTERGARTTITLMFAISIIAALLAVAIALYSADRVAKPLVPLTVFMRGVAATGDITLRAEDAALVEKFSRSGDELGLAFAATREFLGRVTEISDFLGNVADGDLSARLPLLSGRDAIGLALGKTMDSLNMMFAEINDTSAQVATGSLQVADGAQAIASGAAEQASSIEELSQSIADVSERTRRNAERAEQASLLAHTIMDNAEKGRLRMEAMLSASARISEASHAIGRVIQTIDEIAFQTNILAINASVEAAHAGRQGKGFAVVAGEVRNLAARSAKAAKDTESLIADSVEKAELGVQIAEETSASLAEIVSGINESGRLVSDIASSSGEQSRNIGQITASIDHVSQVVQQNSATAEQSAAASEEMSRQSDALRRLIAQFKLRA